jgi:hypothetical protein
MKITNFRGNPELKVDCFVDKSPRNDGLWFNLNLLRDLFNKKNRAGKLPIFMN